MKKISKYIIAVVAVVGAGALVFSQNVTGLFNLQTATLPVSEDNVEKIQNPTYFLSSFKMIPFVSQKQSRKNICALKIDGPIKTVCGKRYNAVRAKDTAKIDELFVILREVNDSAEPTEMAKYLTTQLIFSTLPMGTAKKASAEAAKTLQTSVVSSQLVAQNGSGLPAAGISRADYVNQMQNDYDTVKSNCPQPGDENWVFSAMCSEYKWVNGVQEPIYSKQYAEYGGTCMSEAGSAEGTKIQSIVETKMRSEYDFVNEKGTSSEIACSFSCASYKCPRNEQAEAERTQCKNPIYYPMYNRKVGDKLTLKDHQFAFVEAKTDCFDRAYDYVKNPDGTSSLKKVRSCELTAKGTAAYYDPNLKRMIPVKSFCCSCDRPQRDPYVSIYDFNQPGYRGDDWFRRIIDVTKRKINDVLPPKRDTPPAQPPVQDVPPKQPVEDATPPPVQPLVTPPTNLREEKQEVKVDRLRFTCSVSKERDSDGVLNVRLNGKTEWVEADGKPAYASYYGIQHGGGVANVGGSCIGNTDEVSVCVDPRTNQSTNSPLDFTMEYVPTAQRTVEVISAEANNWFWSMTGKKRKCQESELPPESFFR